MECKVPAVPNRGGNILDLCWLDEDTIIVGQNNGGGVLKLQINTESGTCSSSDIDTGFTAWKVGCSSGKEFYVTDLSRQSVRFYDAAGVGEEWQPQEVSRPYSIAVNDEFIIVGDNSNSPLSVYNRKREFLYSLSLGGDQYQILFSHLTPNGFLLASTYNKGHFLYIHNLNDNATVRVGGEGRGDGQFNHAAGVTDIPGNKLLICDFANSRISAFTQAGSFINQLVYDGARITSPFAISALTPAGKPTIMALKGYPSDTVKFYTLNP